MDESTKEFLKTFIIVTELAEEEYEIFKSSLRNSSFIGNEEDRGLIGNFIESVNRRRR